LEDQLKRSQQKIITTKSKIIRFMRVSKKISQPDAARAAGCSPQAIGHYENGRMGVPENRLRRLLALYDFTNDEFSEYLNGKPIPLISVKDECLQLIDQIGSVYLIVSAQKIHK
jgi:transcriptional regulator with XRE-family HTH domain